MAGGQPSESGHALFGGNFLFQTLEFGEILKIDHVAGGLSFSGSQRRNREAKKMALTSVGSKGTIRPPCAAPEDSPRSPGPIARSLASNRQGAPPRTLVQAQPRDFLRRAVDQHDAAAEVGRDQTSANRVDDFFIEILQIL